MALIDHYDCVFKNGSESPRATNRGLEELWIPFELIFSQPFFSIEKRKNKKLNKNEWGKVVNEQKYASLDKKEKRKKKVYKRDKDNPGAFLDQILGSVEWTCVCLVSLANDFFDIVHCH